MILVQLVAIWRQTVCPARLAPVVLFPHPGPPPALRVLPEHTRQVVLVFVQVAPLGPIQQLEPLLALLVRVALTLHLDRLLARPAPLATMLLRPLVRVRPVQLDVTQPTEAPRRALKCLRVSLLFIVRRFALLFLIY